MALTTDLEAYYNLDDNVNDSVNAHDGVNTNCSYVYGKNNNCLQADGTGDEKVEFDDIDFPGALSISLWFYLNSMSDHQFLISDARWSQTPQCSFGLKCKSPAQNMLGEIYDSEGNRIVADSSIILDINKWYHVAMTYDGHTLQIYVNGVADGSGTAISDGLQNANNVLRMMSILNSSDLIRYPVDGKLDEVGLWTRGLSSAEVTELYNNGTGKFFNGTSFGEPTAGAIAALKGVLFSNISQINSILVSNIAKVNGIST